VELRDGATVNSDLINKFCNEIPSSQYTTGNMLYVHFFTDVTNPKNGFKANVSIGKSQPCSCSSDGAKYDSAVYSGNLSSQSSDLRLWKVTIISAFQL
jgi:hypothetical protein